MMRRDIFLYGPPGSGKSAVGRQLAQTLLLPFIDLDEEIERTQGQTIAQIFAASGEAVFRHIERSALLALPETDGRRIISLGGGTLLNSANREWVEKRGEILFLETDFDTALERLSGEPQNRPLLKNGLEVSLAELYGKRAEHYATFPKRVNTDHCSIAEIIWQAQMIVGHFHLHAMGDYPVYIQSGGLSGIGASLRTITAAPIIALIIDENVGRLYASSTAENLRTAGFEVVNTQIPSGEQYKTIETVTALWDQLLSHGVGRDGLVLSLGGGVVSDLAGFTAATYLRGIRWAVLPTTLLAMADASLGGKTGIDLPGGKNLAGAFHPPSLVLADPVVLSTLPDIEWRSGMAEIVKHGIIGDALLFSMCAALPQNDISQTHPQNLLELVQRAMAVKIQVIEKDPFEKGERAALNLGHTIGHAVELASGYRLRHGEAVAIGLVQEARLSERIGLGEAGLAQQIEQVIKNLGLPVEIPDHLSHDEIEKAVLRDKKKKNGKVHFALPVQIGRVQTGIEIKEIWR